MRATDEIDTLSHHNQTAVADTTICVTHGMKETIIASTTLEPAKCLVEYRRARAGRQRGVGVLHKKINDTYIGIMNVGTNK
jgi:hypothetical protein